MLGAKGPKVEFPKITSDVFFPVYIFVLVDTVVYGVFTEAASRTYWTNASAKWMRTQRFQTDLWRWRGAGA